MKTRAIHHWRFFGTLGAAVLACGIGACASLPPVRAVRAARYYASGTDALERGDARTAVDELEHAAALVPTASEIQNHLGLAYWSAGREADAERTLERAVELDCGNEAARANLERLRAARSEAAVAPAHLPAQSRESGGSDGLERSTSHGG